MPKHAAKTDTNQPAMVAALETAGFSVLLLHRAGEGVHDLAVGCGGVTLLVEVKMPGKKLTDKEGAVHARFTGAQMVAEEPAKIVNWFYSKTTMNYTDCVTKLDAANAVYAREMTKLTAPAPKRKYTRKALKPFKV